MSSSPTLASKTCLVTGAGGGLGKDIAKLFLQAGAKVVICDNHEGRLAEAQAELTSLGALTALVVDVTNREAVDKLFADISAKHGRLDIVVNNAAIMDDFSPVGDVDPDLWDRVLAVNLTGPMLVSRLAVRSMLDGPNPGGYIVNISSVSAKLSSVAGAAYTASKQGLVGLTKNTACFYRDKGIICLALLAGAMPGTNMVTPEAMAKVHPEGFALMEKIRAGTGSGFCSTEIVAEICLSIVRDPHWRLINGSIIPVDGGWMSVAA